MRRRAAINWAISSYFGWGVYGLNLALQWANDPDIELMSALPVTPEDIDVDPIQRRMLAPFMALSRMLQGAMPAFGSARTRLECPVLSDIDLGPQGFVNPVSGHPTVGLTFFETTRLSPQAVARVRALPVIVAVSNWNKCILNEHGLDNVVTVLQGIDPALFHPASAAGWLADRFCVFSGGKLEYRKAQDIVVAAFRVFAARHKDALLVTAWHCPWQGLARSLDVSGLASPVRFTPSGEVDVAAWVAANGIGTDELLDLGAMPNRQMPAVLREMDIAVFPNRCEPGTNLVAMECMACGVPVILSRNTGHLDLMDPDNCFPLEQQAPLGGDRAWVGSAPGWGESSVDEVVRHLEHAFADRQEARRRGSMAAAGMAALTWQRTARRLKEVVLSL